MMRNVLAALVGVLIGSLVNTYVNFEARDRPLMKWYLRLYYKNILSIVTYVGFGSIFFFVSSKYEPGYSLSYMVLLTLLTASSITDIKDRIIPNKLIIFGLISGVTITLLNFSYSKVIDSLIALAVSAGVLLAASFMSKGGVGMGDVKLMACTGMLLGLERTISVMVISFIASALAGIILVIFKRYNRKTKIPFAPFVLISVVLMVLTG